MGDPTFISGGTLTEPGAMVHLASGVTTNATTTNIVFTATAADVNDWSQYQDMMWVYNGSTTTNPNKASASPVGIELRLQMNNSTVTGNFGMRYTTGYTTAQNGTSYVQFDYDNLDYSAIANNAGGSYSHGGTTGVPYCTAAAYGYIPNPGGGMAKLVTSCFGSAQSNEGISNSSWIGFRCFQMGWYDMNSTSTANVMDRTFQDPITELDFYVTTGYFTQDTRIDLYGIYHKMDRT